MCARKLVAPRRAGASIEAHFCGLVCVINIARVNDEQKMNATTHFHVLYTRRNTHVLLPSPHTPRPSPPVYYLDVLTSRDYRRGYFLGNIVGHCCVTLSLKIHKTPL